MSAPPPVASSRCTRHVQKNSPFSSLGLQMDPGETQPLMWLFLWGMARVTGTWVFCLHKISFCPTRFSPQTLSRVVVGQQGGAGRRSEDPPPPGPRGRADLCGGTVADGGVRKVCERPGTGVQRGLERGCWRETWFQVRFRDLELTFLSEARFFFLFSLSLLSLSFSKTWILKPGGET